MREALKGQEHKEGYQMGRDGTNHGKTLGLRNTNSSFPTDCIPGSSLSLCSIFSSEKVELILFTFPML